MSIKQMQEEIKKQLGEAYCQVMSQMRLQSLTEGIDFELLIESEYIRLTGNTSMTGGVFS